MSEWSNFLSAMTLALVRVSGMVDAPRLEELALSCEALNRHPDSMDAGEKSELARQAREAAPDMAVLGRVLAVPRANQNVMRRLREMRERRLESSERQIRGAPEAGAEAEAVDGDD